MGAEQSTDIDVFDEKSAREALGGELSAEEFRNLAGHNNQITKSALRDLSFAAAVRNSRRSVNRG